MILVFSKGNEMKVLLLVAVVYLIAFMPRASLLAFLLWRRERNACLLISWVHGTPAAGLQKVESQVSLYPEVDVP